MAERPGVDPSGRQASDHDLDEPVSAADFNGRLDVADVVPDFNPMAWIGANEPVTAFDYNGNGRTDFADVVLLFNHL